MRLATRGGLAHPEPQPRIRAGRNSGNSHLAETCGCTACVSELWASGRWRPEGTRPPPVARHHASGPQLQATPVQSWSGGCSEPLGRQAQKWHTETIERREAARPSSATVAPVALAWLQKALYPPG